LLVAALYGSAFGWLSERKLREVMRGDDQLNGELDEYLACDLVTDFVLARESYRKVKCQGALEVTGWAARFVGVKVDWEERTYCLARTPKWTVLRSSKGVPCFPNPPPDPSQALASEDERVMARVTAQVNGRLAGIRTAMASRVRPAKCTKRKSTQHNDVPLLEYELLQGDGRSEDWAFLSSTWLRDAVIRGDRDSLLTAVERWDRGRPWVAVVTSASREQAMSGVGRGGFMRGRLTGTITLVDAEAGELLCEAPFEFESSVALPQVPNVFGKKNYRLAPIIDQPTQERVRSDFEARYKSAAMKTLNEMTGYDAWPSVY
jgi:hypothetical protein